MQSARDLVGIVVEFPAGMKFRQNDLGGRLSLLRHDLRGNAAAVVVTVTEPSIWMTDVNFRAVARERLIDGVVDNFVDQVVKSVDAR